MLLTLFAAVAIGTGIMNVRKEHEALHNKALMWRDVVDSIPSGLVVADREGRVIAWNHGAEQLLGWQEDDVVGANITFLMPTEAARARHTEAITDAAVVEKLRNGAILEFSCHALTKTGDLQHVRVRVTGIHDGYKYFLAHISREEDVAPVIQSQKPLQCDVVPIQPQCQKAH
jgi:PAS domain S-box-containing protein